MEDDGGVRAPATRLRRRLSVEQSEDTNSPGPATPTKRRAGKSAAKPQLELIDENTPATRLRRRLSVEQSEDTNSPGPATPTKRKAGKLAAKPQLELIDENTPGSSSKRSTRKTVVKDVSEVSEENVVTPSRRSARIKSNTSLVSEAIKTYASPRAKRAARRTSQVGSDTETTLTPTRTTRKDSTSSSDKLETTLGSVPSNITVVIIEESEFNDDKDTSENLFRKSPELRAKDNQVKESKIPSHNKSQEVIDDVINNTVNNVNIIKKDEYPQTANETTTAESDNKASVPQTLNNDDSDTSINAIKNLDTNHIRKSSKVNKSTSDIENKKESSNVKNKSQRAMSLSGINDPIFCSDNEISKKNIKRSLVSKKLTINNSRSGDNQIFSHDTTLNLSEFLNSGKDTLKELYISKNKEQSNDESIIVLDTQNKRKEKLTLDKSFNNSTSISKSKSSKNDITDDTNSITKVLEKPQSSPFFENSSDTKKATETLVESGVQSNTIVVVVECISVDNINNETDMKSINTDIKTDIENPTNNKMNDINFKNNSCEPMDVDETIPNSTVILETSQLEHSIVNQKKMETLLHDETSLNKSSNNSSSLCTSQNLEKTCNDNKSTLIISEIKDMSSAENSVSKSPHNEVSRDLLSKSANYEVIKNKGCDRKNLSLDYSTSTPIQQKKHKKLGMQINTPIIDSSTNKHNKSKEEPSISKKEMSRISKNSDTSDEDQTEEETNSNFLDDEAEDASDDYKSGDSQDEDDRQYEEANEILEKGETLDSEHEMSNDTDYDKDSFVVSSNEEDHELLSGSGDDLSMNDNELTMSKTSKKKYNERKVKEQKNASKEMFAARHKLDVSKNKSTRKSRKIDSSSDSEDDVIAPIKKNKNQILDDDDSIDLSNASGEKPKKKRLSESLHCEITNKEQEISIVFDKNVTQPDPLCTQVKIEPKTPLKDLNMSSVQIYDNVEEAEVENNTSIENTNQSQDPLQIPMAEEDNDSSISENSEIIKNYDSVLNELNCKEKTKVKTQDMSLNLNKKNKKHPREPILDQLNLTHSNSYKNKKDNLANNSTHSHQSKNKLQNIIPFHNENDTSSDSIDLQLLFSDESRGSFHDQKIENDIAKKKDDFIPLKRTRGKINIVNEDNDPALNNDDKIHFIIDTEGTRDNIEESVKVISSKKKKNKKSLNDSSRAHVFDATNDKNDDAPLEISFKSVKNDKISKENEIFNTDAADVSIKGSTKKKKKSSRSLTEDTNKYLPTLPQPIDSGKKKKLSKSTDIGVIEASLQILNSGKKKKKSLTESLPEPIEDSSTIPQNISIASTKKINGTLTDVSVTQAVTEDSSFSEEISNSKKRKRKSSLQNKKDADDATNDKNDDAPLEISFKSAKNDKISKENEIFNTAAADVSIKGSTKKKKKSSVSLTEDTNIGVIEASLQILNSGKKKKKSLTESLPEPIEDSSTIPQNISIESTKKINGTLTDVSVTQAVTKDPSFSMEISNSKKRKRKSSVQNKNEADADKEQLLDVSQSQPLNTSVSTSRQKKKRKLTEKNVTYNTEDDEDEQKVDKENYETSNVKKKTSSLMNEEKSIQSTHESGHQRKKNKRKRDDDDIVTEVSKVLKQNSFDKVHVTRLPSSFLSQLDDKPMQGVLEKKKSMIISTTSFNVEETKKRKNKPSNYLEESVYLNDSNIDKKHKNKIKKPKVLPFVPTATTSDSGFTTNFKIKIIPHKVEFVAQTKTEANFKNEYLYGKKIKRQGTYEMYKKHRSAKMSKF